MNVDKNYKKKKQMKIIEERCLERTQGKNVRIHSRLKDIQIIGQRKAFCSQRIPESRRARNETVDIISFISFHYILITSINGDRKIMQPIRITSGPITRWRKWNQFIQCRRASTKVIPSGKTYLSWLYFDDEPNVQEGQ